LGVRVRVPPLALPLITLPVMGDHDEALAFALELALLGGRLAIGHFGTELETKQKADGTWVTEADWAVEAQIRLRIARTFPDHNILGEEEGLTAAGGGPAVDGAPTWVIDPIDGTNNYKAGIPIWATLVALQIDGESVVGVAHAPAIGETYDAAIGSGARCNGSPISVNDVGQLSAATVLNAGVKYFYELGMGGFLDAVTKASWRTRGFGDFWGHMLVARGAAEAMVEADLATWDVAALQPIVSEAGGRLTHLDGTPWSGSGSVLTSNSAIHTEIVDLYKKTATT
jgi:histidinol-phosphatase